MTKTARVCEGCAEQVLSRFRTMLNSYLCDPCYTLWQRTGEVPTPEPRMENPTRW